MGNGKTALAVIMVILGFVGFGLTYGVFSVLNDWNNLPTSELQIIGSRLYLILPALLGIFSLMFELIGLYFFFESTE